MNGELPPFFFFSLSSKTPTAVIGERIFYAEPASGEEELYENFFRFGANGQRESYNLKESMKASALEQIYTRHNKRSISGFEGTFLREVLREAVKPHEELQKNKALNFVLNEVFPHLRARADAYGEANVRIRTGRRYETSETGPDTYVDSMIKKLVDEKPKASLFHAYRNAQPDYSPESILGKALMGTNVLAYKGGVYKLEITMRPNDWKTLVNANGASYRPSVSVPIRNLEDNFKFEFERDLKLQFLRKKLENDNEWRSIQSNVKELLGAQEYNEKDFGFRRHSQTMYDVFLKVPEFVLRDPGTSDYYHFRGTKVYVRVGCEGRDVGFVQKTPFTMGTYPHPFTGRYGERGYGDDVSDTSICMGGYNYGALDRMEKGMAVAKVLLDAKNVLMCGYQEGVNPRAHLESFPDSMRISARDIRARGLQVTNAIVNRPQRGRRARRDYDDD